MRPLLGQTLGRGLIILLLPALTVGTCAGCGSTPQLNGDEEALGAADALWTAIGAQRRDLVDQSAQEFDRLHAAQQMSDEAFAALSDIVATAREGDWSDARQDLKSFVQGQRRAPK
jgi:hypothetical protein